MIQPHVLSISNLRTSFLSNGQWRPVISNISFDIAHNETLAIVGESGSGKSVTALSVMRLTPPRKTRVEGSIKLNGEELLTRSEAEMRQIRGNDIAMIFQEPMTSLNPVLTIGSQIAESLIIHRGLSRSAARTETLRLLDMVRIPARTSRFDEYPHRFSGGMRQRVMIAMALACKPKLLIADEPTTALDVTIQAQTLELIMDLQREAGMAVLFITHDMGVVAEIADRVVVMCRGEQIEVGPTTDIYSAPKAPYTKSLLSAVPRLGSMQGRARPMRFPVVNQLTGQPDIPREVPETVNPDMPVLEVKGLTTRFAIRGGLFNTVKGNVHAVENVSFDLKAGETLALVGESGCGKSTTGRSILRLTDPESGSVMLDGIDLLTLEPGQLRQQRKRIQMVFQDPFASLDPRMTVGAAIAEPLLVDKSANRSAVRDRVADLLERVGLSASMASRFPHEFSGGQRQRVCIARALSLEPKVVVADEAVSALDVSVKGQIINLMLDLQSRLGLSYLFISHDMAVVERLCHRVAVMYLGEIVEIGTRQAIFENPQHPYTKRLLAAVPIADPAQRSRPRHIPDAETRSPVHPAGYVPPVREYREISPGHFVMVWGDDWGG